MLAGQIAVDHQPDLLEAEPCEPTVAIGLRQRRRYLHSRWRGLDRSQLPPHNGGMADDKSQEVLRSFRGSADASSFKLVLTPREAEVLQMVADGLGNKQIAQKLFLSGETIKSCVDRIRGKLDARNRAHAVSIAIRHGLIH